MICFGIQNIVNKTVYGRNPIYFPEPQTRNPVVLLQIAVRVLVEVVML